MSDRLDAGAYESFVLGAGLLTTAALVGGLLGYIGHLPVFVAAGAWLLTLVPILRGAR